MYLINLKILLEKNLNALARSFEKFQDSFLINQNIYLGTLLLYVRKIRL